MSEKNIINQSGYSNSSGSGSSSTLPLVDATLNTTFWANGIAGEDDRSINFRVFKLGTSLVFFTLKRFVATMTNVRFWLGSSVIPEIYRPRFDIIVPFPAINGGAGNNFDSDVTSAVIIRAVSGDIEIWRELDPGAGVWNGASQGWLGVSTNYYV